jgi:chemotaxis protein histidine kinase CheA
MIEHVVETPVSDLTVAERLDELVDLLQAALAGQDAPESMAPVRRAIEDLLVETAADRLNPLQLAFRRIGFLAELWECIWSERAAAAQEIGVFCIKAITQLAHCERSGDGCQEVADWIITHSTSCWGDYLGLLEPAAIADEGEAGICLEHDPAADEWPAIDAQALLRLFTGAATAGPARRADQSPQAPASQGSPGLRIPALPRRLDLGDEIREAFLADASDLFDRIQPLVLGLGSAVDPAESFRELARCLHTLKGAAGSVGLADLVDFVHALEEHLESTIGPAAPELIDVLLQTLGYLEGLLLLLRTRPGSEVEQGTPESNIGELDVGTLPAAPVVAGAEKGLAPAQAPTDGPIRIPASRIEDLMDMVSELISRRRLWIEQAESMKAIALLVRNCRSRMLGCLDQLHEAGLAREPVALATGIQAEVPGQLRRLSELADDLAVLAESAQNGAVPLADHGDALGRLTMQLWDELHSIRVVAIRGLFQRLARVAQETARIDGKQVDVVTIGEESGVDRAVQDKAFEPLLHVVRNAVGHGVERPSDRLKAGKPAAGRLTLEARREGNTLLISVQDDGRGLDHQAIAAKARSLGLLGPGENATGERLNSLIFHTGFSTKAQADAISGRGVGMDVVAREVGRLKGTVELRTEAGRGTRLTVHLPARLALETTMIIRVDGQAFALPVAQIEHARPFEAEEIVTDGVTEGQTKPGSFLVFRDRKIPVLRAREILGLGSTPEPAWPKLLVVRSAGGLIGLIVDAIEGTEELVIKSLGSLLAGHPMISGTSCSASGEVISILNLAGLHHWVALGAAPEQSGPLMERGDGGSHAPPAVLVVDDSISVRKVVARHLQAMGLDVDEAADGLEALARLRSRSYRLVLTDLEMPRLDGFELMAEIQGSSSLSPIPVIAASTRLDQETRRRVLALGARAFLPKPVDATALATAVGPLIAHADS